MTISGKRTDTVEEEIFKLKWITSGKDIYKNTQYIL